MDISEKRTMLNKLLADFISEASQNFMNVSAEIKKFSYNVETQKQLDKIFKKILEFGRSIGNEISIFFNEYEELTARHEKLKAENKRLETLYLSGILFQSETEMKSLMQKAIVTIITELNADEGFIVLVNDNLEIETIISKNMDSIKEEEAKKISLSVIKNTFEKLEPLKINDITSQNEFSRKTSIISAGLTSILCVPLVSNDSVLGAVYIGREKEKMQFSNDDLVFLVAFAKQVVKGIELSLEIGALESKLNSDFRNEMLQLRKEFKCDEIIGNSVKLFNILKIAHRVSDTDASVLIQGENGTGKDLLAHAIHNNSSRKEMPFIAINCGAIPTDLLESELFGYESGAFTGAVKTKPGKLEMAHGGTVFLDEIAEMSVNLQTKLLRVIQTKEIERLGGTSSRKIDVRFIAATNKILSKQIEENNFREDLYYRLKVIEIKIPPLRERKEDIEILIEHFLNKYRKHGEKLIAQPEVYEILESYDWPGNIRELENVIHRCVILAKSNIITVNDLPPEIIENQQDIIKIQEQKTLLDAETEFRKMYILKTLRKTSSKAEAAQMLGINRTHLYKLLNQLGIE